MRRLILVPIAFLPVLMLSIAPGNAAASRSSTANPARPGVELARLPRANTLTVTFGGTCGLSVSGADMSVSTEPDRIVVYNPTKISLEGTIEAHQKVVDNDSFYAWQAAGAAVIVKQPASWTAPAFENGTIRFEDAGLEPSGPTIAGDLEASARIRIRICNTWPNADVSLELMRCVAGGYRCMSCITTEY